MLLEWCQLLLALAELPAKLVDAPVVVGILEGAGHILVDVSETVVYIIGHIAELVVIVITAATRRTHLGMHGIGTVHHCLPECLLVLVGDVETGEHGVGNDGGRVVADHAVAMAGAEPLRQESALAIYIRQCCLYLLVGVGIKEIEQREQTTEDIPETGVGIHVSVYSLAVERTVVHCLARGIHLPKHSWEEYRTIEA